MKTNNVVCMALALLKKWMTSGRCEEACDPANSKYTVIDDCQESLHWTTRMDYWTDLFFAQKKSFLNSLTRFN